MQIIGFAAVKRERLFEVQDVIRFTIDLNARHRLVNALRFGEINQRKDEHGNKGRDDQPASFQNDMPIVAQIDIVVRQCGIGRENGLVFHELKT